MNCKSKCNFWWLFLIFFDWHIFCKLLPLSSNSLNLVEQYTSSELWLELHPSLWSQNGLFSDQHPWEGDNFFADDAKKVDEREEPERLFLHLLLLPFLHNECTILHQQHLPKWIGIGISFSLSSLELSIKYIRCSPCPQRKRWAHCKHRFLNYVQFWIGFSFLPSHRDSI